MSAADPDAMADLFRELNALASLCDDALDEGQNANGAVRATPSAPPKTTTERDCDDNRK